MIWWSLAFAAGGDALVQDVLSNSAELAVLEARLGADDAVRVRPRETEFRPVVRDLGSATREPSVSLRLRQPLAPPGSLRAARRELEAQGPVERLELYLLAFELRVDTLTAFDEGRIALAERTLLDEQIGLLDQLVSVLELRLNGGLDVADDLADAVVERAELQQRRTWLDLAVRDAEADLTAAAGRAITLVADDLEAEATAPLSDWSPVVANTGGVLEAEAALAARRAERRPFLDWVQAELETNPDERVSYGLAANVEIPFWRFLDGEVTAAKAEVAARKQEAAHRAAASRSAADAASTRWQRHRDALQASRAGWADASAAIDQLADRLAPDALLEVRADLIEQRRRHLKGVEATLAARRAVDFAREHIP